MKTNILTKQFKSSFVVPAYFVLGITTAMAAPPTTVADAYGTVVIGDLPGMMDRGAELAKSVNPGISGDVLRGQLGVLLGDEGLKSIPAGSGLVLVAPKGEKAFFLLETAEGQAENVANLIKQRLTGSLTKAVNDKLVAVARDQASMDKASAEMGQAAAALLEGNDDKFVVATLDSDTLMKDKGADFHAMLQRFSQKAAQASGETTTGSADAIAFIGHLVSASAKRTDVVQLKIDISGNGVLLEKTLWPIGGLNPPQPQGPTGQELLKNLSGADNAMIRYDYYLDTQWTMNSIVPIFKEALSGIGIPEADQADMVNLFNLAGQGFGDGIAGWLTPTSDKGVRGVYLWTVNDRDKALQYIEQAASAATTGSMATLYEGMGMKTSATLVRNATTLNGQPVHSFSMSMKPADGGDALPMSKLYNIEKSYITNVDDKMVMTFGDVPLEQTVSAIKSGSGGGTDLKSRAELPPNGALYLDYNFGAVMASMGDQDPNMAKFAEALKDVMILEAAYVDNESIKFMMLLPGDAVQGMMSGIQSATQQQAGQTTATDTGTTTPMAVEDSVTTTGI